MPTFTDSVDKIVRSYFSAMVVDPFVYKGRTIIPKPLRVSPDICRTVECEAGCGACCPRFSLDYLPNNVPKFASVRRTIRILDQDIVIHSNLQSNNHSNFCQFLSMKNGRCKVYTNRPFSCDFELLRFSISTNNDRTNHLTCRQYGRAWNMLRIDGGRGTRCCILPPSISGKEEARRKLILLKEWLLHFNLDPRRVDETINWLDYKRFPTSPLFLK